MAQDASKRAAESSAVHSNTKTAEATRGCAPALLRDTEWVEKTDFNGIANSSAKDSAPILSITSSIKEKSTTV